MDRKEAQTPLTCDGRVLVTVCHTPRQVVREWPADPVVQHEETSRRQETMHFAEHGERIVKEMQDRRHADQMYASRREGEGLRCDIVDCQRRSCTRIRQLLTIGNHRWGHVVAIQGGLRIALAERLDK